MRTLLSSLLLAFALSANAAQQLGTILLDNFNRGSVGTDWTNEGNIFTSISGNQFYLTNTAADVWNALTANTNLTFMAENYVIECDLTMTNAGFGVGLGVRDVSSVGAQNWFMWLEMDHSPSEIALIQWGSPALVAVKATGSATLVHTNNGTVNDTIHLYLRRSNNTFICNATNTSLASSATALFEMNTASTPDTVLSPGPAHPALWQVSTQPSFVDNFTMSSLAIVPANLLLVGDSITSGLVVTTMANRWASGLRHGVSVQAGPGRGILDAIKCLPFIGLLRPQRVLIMIGGNDAFDAGFTNNYNSFTTSLSNMGASVFHALPTPRTSTDKRTFKDWMVATYPTTHLDTFTNLLAPDGHSLTNTMDSGDLTHPNDLGHAVAATNVFYPVPDNPNALRFRQTYHTHWSFF